MGAVAHICPRTGTIGMSRPSRTPTAPHHAPAASTRLRATIEPCGVTASQPGARGVSAVTSRCVRMRAPRRPASAAKARVARAGSACERSGEYMAPSSAGESSGSRLRASRVVSSSTW